MKRVKRGTEGAITSGCMAGLALVILTSMSTAIMAGETAGIIKTAKGTATIERGGQKLAATVGTAIESRDRIITGADSAVGITLRDNTMLSAGPNSTLDLNKFAFDSTTHAGEMDASIKRGTLAVISGKIAKANPDAVRFSSPSVTLGVRGTEFVLEAGQTGE